MLTAYESKHFPAKAGDLLLQPGIGFRQRNLWNRLTTKVCKVLWCNRLAGLLRELLVQLLKQTKDLILLNFTLDEFKMAHNCNSRSSFSQCRHNVLGTSCCWDKNWWNCEVPLSSHLLLIDLIGAPVKRLKIFKKSEIRFHVISRRAHFSRHASSHA